MAVLTREQFMERLNAVVGENTDDNSLSLLEDFTDTFDSFNNSESVQAFNDLKARYDDLAKRHRERFNSNPNPEKLDPSTGNEPPMQLTEEEIRAESIKIEDL